MNTPRGTGQKGQCCPFGRRPVWLEGTASPPEWCTGTWQTAQLPLGPRFLPGHPMPHPVGPSLHTPPQMNNTQELEVRDFSYFTKLITNYFHWNKYCFQRHSFPHRIPVLKLPFQSVLDSYTISQFNTCDPGWLLTFPHDTPLLLLLHLYLTRGGRGNALRGRKEQIYLTILQISIKHLCGSMMPHCLFNPCALLISYFFFISSFWFSFIILFFSAFQSSDLGHEFYYFIKSVWFAHCSRGPVPHVTLEWQSGALAHASTVDLDCQPWVFQRNISFSPLIIN